MKNLATPLVTPVVVLAAAFWLMAAKDLTETLGLDFSTTEIEIVPVSGPISMLVGQGGNIGVSVGDDGVFLVDDQFAPLTERILAAVRTLSDRPVEYVVNTHWHYDHTGGNRNLGTAGALLVAHDNARRRLAAGQTIEPFGTVVPPEPAEGLPVVTFSDTLTFHLNGETVQVFHVQNAHTDGDAIVHFQGSNAFHMGDTYFNGMYPFIDVSSGGSVTGVLRAVDAVLARADDATKIIPGHGPLSDRKELVAYREMLTTAKRWGTEAIEAGMTREQMIADKILSDLDRRWGNGPISPARFLSILHTDLVIDGAQGRAATE
jgi:glyoxylase-like metal-dependent hydrolase (beta-lactamase superfamily II)